MQVTLEKHSKTCVPHGRRTSQNGNGYGIQSFANGTSEQACESTRVRLYVCGMYVCLCVPKYFLPLHVGMRACASACTSGCARTCQTGQIWMATISPTMQKHCSYFNLFSSGTCCFTRVFESSVVMHSITVELAVLQKKGPLPNPGNGICGLRQPRLRRTIGSTQTRFDKEVDTPFRTSLSNNRWPASCITTVRTRLRRLNYPKLAL